MLCKIIKNAGKEYAFFFGPKIVFEQVMKGEYEYHFSCRVSQ